MDKMFAKFYATRQCNGILQSLAHFGTAKMNIKMWKILPQKPVISQPLEIWIYEMLKKRTETVKSFKNSLLTYQVYYIEYLLIPGR